MKKQDDQLTFRVPKRWLDGLDDLRREDKGLPSRAEVMRRILRKELVERYPDGGYEEAPSAKTRKKRNVPPETEQAVA